MVDRKIIISFIVILITSILLTFLSHWPQATKGEVSKSLKSRYIILSLQWQPGICRLYWPNRRCIITPEPRFSIYGIWEDHQEDERRSVRSFNFADLDESLTDRLNEDWVSMFIPNQFFWELQYDRHAKFLAAFKSPRKYLEGGLELFDRIRPNECLREAGIEASGELINRRRFTRVLSSCHQQHLPQITCGIDNTYVTQIRFCFTHDGNEPIDCPDRSTRCGQSVSLIERW